MRFHGNVLKLQPGLVRRPVRSGILAFALILAGLDGVAGQGLIGTRAARPQFSLAEANAVHLVTTPESARLTFDLTQGVESETFVLANPDRVIVDLPQVDFNLGPDAGKPAEKHNKQAAIIESFRFGLLSPGRSRIVIDLGSPARIVRSAVENSGDKYQLVIDLAKTDRASFRLAAQSRKLAAAIPAATPSRDTPLAGSSASKPMAAPIRAPPSRALSKRRSCSILLRNSPKSSNRPAVLPSS
jgi:N-acetylmuramoyl-L-alanine amidase